MKKILLSLILFSVAVAAHAQSIYVSGTYNQSFDNLFVSVPADNTTLAATSILPAGWTVVERGLIANTDIRVHSAVGTGGTTGDSLLYGAAGSNERALGSYASAGLTAVFGVRIQNNSGSTLTQFTLTFDGEQWLNGRSELSVFNTQAFSYGVGNESITLGSFTDVAALDFRAPQGGTSGGDIALDGNDAANKTTGITATVTGLSWTNGQSLWLRWVDGNDNGDDDGLAVDNVRFSAVPEPGTSVLLGVGSAFMLWNLRRRRMARAESFRTFHHGSCRRETSGPLCVMEDELPVYDPNRHAASRLVS